jgi:DNA-binding NtrC family response regulator
MDRPIMVVDADKTESRDLCNALERDNYHAIAIHSLGNLEEKIRETACKVVILDLDTLPVDNRFITDLRRQNPGLPIIGLSSRPFHPELKEAMSSHICACLGKPPDLDELIYCVRSFWQDGATSKEGERD